MRPFTREAFGEIAFRHLSLTGLVFLTAQEQELHEVKETLIQAAALPSTCNSRPWTWRAVLPSGDHDRLVSAERSGFLEHPGCGFISLAQAGTFQCHNSWLAPTLIKNSKLYRLLGKKVVGDRLVMPSEYFELQCFPMTCDPNHPARKYFDPTELTDAGVMNLARCRALVSNAMTVPCIGAVLLYALGSFQHN